MASGTSLVDGDPINSCFKCKLPLEDVRAIIQCTVCKLYFHAKCGNVDMRGFHMKKSTWKCGKCEPQISEVKMVDVNKGERSRKRSRVDEITVDQEFISEINANLQFLVEKTKALDQKIDLLLNENLNLKAEIASLKESKQITGVSQQSNKNVAATSTYATVVSKNNDNKVLIVKQKCMEKDIKQVKEDIRKNVNPLDIGAGLSLGKPTKNGGIILKCGNEKELTNIQAHIQEKMGDSYSVDVPKLLNHRIKVVGVHESEYSLTDDEIVSKIENQNSLQNNSDKKIKILRKTKIVNNRFTMVLEVDPTTYGIFIDKEKMNIGWNRCNVFNDYGIRRCFRCCSYGHILKDCTENKVCAKCSGNHDFKECTVNTVKCANCVVSNKKYGLNVDVEHVAWDVNKCESYKRIEQYQRSKYIR